MSDILEKTNTLFEDASNIEIVEKNVAFKHSIKSGRGVVEQTPQGQKAVREIENINQAISKPTKLQNINYTLPIITYKL